MSTKYEKSAITESEINDLVQPFLTTKEMCFYRIQYLYELSNNLTKDETLIDEFMARVEDLSEIQSEFNKCVLNINSIYTKHKPKFVATYSEIKAFDELYYEIRKVSKNLNPPERPARSEPGVREPRRCVKLPELQLIKFDSKLENWITFRDTFKSLIHDNSAISDVEKYYYLLSSVSGPALTIVKAMPITADNYHIVWNALVQRFENKRALATAYLDKLFNFKPLTSESATNLNNFLQTYQENISALELLNIPDLASFILFQISVRNLDSVTRREFEQTVPSGEIPTARQLLNFIEKQTRVLEMSESKPAYAKPSTPAFKQSTSRNRYPDTTKSYGSKQIVTTVVASTNNDVERQKSNICPCCQMPHAIYRCAVYNALTPESRTAKVKNLGLCENCLRDNHTSADCPSKHCCTVCKKRHHSSLHIDSAVMCQGNVVGLTCSTDQTVLLGTAVVHVVDAWGHSHCVRALIDSGAMSSYVTNTCVKTLGLDRRRCDFRTIGLGGNQVQNFGLTTLTIKPRYETSPVLTTDAVIVANIAGNLPTVTVPFDILDCFDNIKLADPEFHRPAPVDLLIAGDLFPYLYDGTKILPKRPGMPVALKSIFGYVITGQVNRRERQDRHLEYTGFSGFSNTDNLDRVMNTFWEIENIPSGRSPKPDDVLAENLFVNEHSRDPVTGRYVVRYPFRPDHNLGDSRQMALRRFVNLESRLNRDPRLKDEYHEFMSEYEALGHMKCLGEMKNVDSKYLIPHFCIHKPTSTSTKLRTVFDASTKTSNNKSLNDVVLTGPKLQADINQILINFRLHKICISADICKMYRQILIHPDQRPYQHILWRYSTDQPVQVYELATVTYGVASSPYLAIKVLHTLADENACEYPTAARVLKNGFFMDDLLWSEPTVTDALLLQQELRALLQSAGFVLCKWSSNSAQVLAAVPEDHRETPIEFDDDQYLSLKVLGLQWQPGTDCFSFTAMEPSHVITKRTVLSQIGRLFDPLGFVAPCVFYAKCFMQKLWALKLDWDQRLPDSLESEWSTFVRELPLLSKFRHERHVMVSRSTTSRIIGFSDASTLGYAAQIYLHTKNDDGDSKVSLLIAKTKVAPLKTISVPRLELMAAHLLSKLVKYIISILQDRGIGVNDIMLFTDSSVVLAWLNTPSYKLKTFVATRVTKILDTVPSTSWFHVSGESNPSDVCSRGATPSALLLMPEWLSGPNWLLSEHWPVRSIDEFKHENPPELKTTHDSKVLFTMEDSFNLIYELSEKYSSYTKLVNIVAWVRKFITNCRIPKAERTKLSLSSLKEARASIIKSVQQHYFATDIALISKALLPQRSLQKLNPFVDPHGILRVGGRLSLAQMSFDKKHPILLPKKCNFTSRLIDHYHVLYLHAGPRTLQSILSQKFWIVSARSIIRVRINKCISCFKVNPTVRQPAMGQLPRFRTENYHTFHTVGLDIGGPFYVKESTRRNVRVINKAYLCVYVCCATRAVHLETLSSLSTESFFASFDRFTARRGLCHTLISDNAKNFVSAGRQLAAISEFLKTNADQLSGKLHKRNVHWKHNPPTGSHFGGLYEAAIKSAKSLLKRTVGDRTLTFEELSTLFARAEAVLNSRPLCALSSDPNEFEVLTPAHFLVGRSLLDAPEYDLTNLPIHRLTRWQAIQQIAQQFWRLWRKEFLHTLQTRQKWFKGCRELKVGDLVLIHSDAPPLQWLVGRVTKLHPGPDNVTRVVTVRTQNGEFIRPVVKLSPLPVEQDA